MILCDLKFYLTITDFYFSEFIFYPVFTFRIKLSTKLEIVILIAVNFNLSLPLLHVIFIH